MSSPIQPSGTSVPSLTRRSAPASKRSPSTRSTGSSSRQSDDSAFSSALRASSTPSSSTSESPVGMPWARKKLKHIAPPISSVSAVSRNLSIRAILSDTFAPPSTTTSGRSGRLDDRAQRGHLALQQQPGHRRPQVLGHPGGRRVRPVRGAERVVHVGVGERRQLAGQLGIVLGLASLPAGVLEHEHAARAELLDPAPYLRADHLRRLEHRGVDQLAEPVRHRPQRGLRIAALGPPQVRAQDQPHPALEQQLDRGQRRAYTRVVGYPAALERHVEVHSGEHPLARFGVEVSDGALAESGRGARLRQPAPPRGHAASGPQRGWSSPTRCRTTQRPSRASRRSPSSAARRRSTSRATARCRSTRAGPRCT